MNTGKSIKLALIHKGWSQGELTEKLGMSKSAVNILANGGNCSSGRLRNLADAFGMKVSEFIALGEDKEVGHDT